MARLPAIDVVVPVAFGSAIVEYGDRGRRVYVYGATADADRAWSWNVSTGQNLPVMDWERGSAVTVLGAKLKRELFGESNPLGAVVRIGQARYRVIGVMESKGQFLGFDLDDTALVPVANAMQLFNLSELSEIDVMVGTTDAIDPFVRRATALLRERHEDTEDFTIVTQKDAQETIDRILGIVSGVVTGIAGISLLVGAIGILTIMWIVVNERVSEIGLVKALGARPGQIVTWYLFEAAVVALAGGITGLTVGIGGASLLSALIPGLSTFTPPGMVMAALLMAVGVGLGAGVAPALRAARLDPVERCAGSDDRVEFFASPAESPPDPRSRAWSSGPARSGAKRSWTFSSIKPSRSSSARPPRFGRCSRGCPAVGPRRTKAARPGAPTS